MPLLGPSDWPDVRRALDASLTAATLPDSVIGSPIYWLEAERLVKLRVPGVDGLSDEDRLYARNAAIFLLASLVAPVVPVVVREQDKDYSYQRQTVDWGAVASMLADRADAVMAVLAGEDTTASGSVSWLFGLASGCRGA